MLAALRSYAGNRGLRGDRSGPVTSLFMAAVRAVHDHEGEVTGVVQRAHLPSGAEHRQRGIEQGATLLLGIDGLDLVEVVLEDLEDLEQDAGRVMHLTTGDEAAAACPSCEGVSPSP